MSLIQFLCPPVHKFTDPIDYDQWSKTLYLALHIMGFERFILEQVDYTDDDPDVIAKRNLVMLMMESSISDAVKVTLCNWGYDNSSLDPKVLFDQAYHVFYKEDKVGRYAPPGYKLR